MKRPHENRPSEDILDILQDGLNRHARAGAIANVSGLDGYLAAVACAPGVLLPSQWMPALWGGDEHAPEWDTMEEAQKFLGALLTMANDISRLLAQGRFEPILLGDPEDKGHTVAHDWCLGFLQGVKCWPPLSGRDREVLEEALVLPAVFVTEEGAGALDKIGEAEVAALVDAIAAIVHQLYDHFSIRVSLASVPARAGRKVGRNDPCPCGSGKKFKHCCLHHAPDHAGR